MSSSNALLIGLIEIDVADCGDASAAVSTDGLSMEDATLDQFLTALVGRAGQRALSADTCGEVCPVRRLRTPAAALRPTPRIEADLARLVAELHAQTAKLRNHLRSARDIAE